MNAVSSCSRCISRFRFSVYSVGECMCVSDREGKTAREGERARQAKQTDRQTDRLHVVRMITDSESVVSHQSP